MVKEGVDDFEKIEKIMREEEGFRMGNLEILDMKGINV